MNRKGKFEEFNDGVLKIYGIDEENKLYCKNSFLRYGEEKMGISRFYAAQTADVEISKVVHIPVVLGTDTHDIVILNDLDVQYEIMLIQLDKTTLPHTLKLSLRKLGISQKKEVREDGQIHQRR